MYTSSRKTVAIPVQTLLRTQETVLALLRVALRIRVIMSEMGSLIAMNFLSFLVACWALEPVAATLKSSGTLGVLCETMNAKGIAGCGCLGE
jgi:hypothetical protein